MKRIVAMLTLILLALWARSTEAHKPSDSYLTLIQPVQGAALEGQWDIALRDLEHAVGLDGNAVVAPPTGSGKEDKEEAARLTKLYQEAP